MEKEFLKRNNYYFIVVWSTLVALIEIAYIVEFIQGKKGLPFLILSLLSGIIPIVIAIIIYRSSAGISTKIKYIATVGYGIFYFICLAVATKPIVCVYYIPLLIVLLVFENQLIMVLANAILIFSNITTIIAWCVVRHETSDYYVAQYKIQIGVMFMIVFTSIMGMRLIKMMNQSRRSVIERQAEQEKEANIHILDTSNSIALSIEEIKNSITDSSNHISSMNCSMGDVNKGMITVAESLQDQTNATLNIQKSMTNISELAQGLVQTTVSSKKNVALTNDEMVRVKEFTEGVKRESSFVIEEMKKLVKNTSKVQGVIEIIASIASQTNLLALNAAIEAARAGEAGRGFSIVADEIRGLADSTQSSLNQIQELLVQLMNGSKAADERMDAMFNEMDQQGECIAVTYTYLNAIKDDMEGLNQKVDQISSSIDDVGKETSQVVEAVNQMSAVSEEVSAASTEVYELSSVAKREADKVSEEAGNIKERMKELVNSKK